MGISRDEIIAVSILAAFALGWALIVIPMYGDTIDAMNPVLGYLVYNTGVIAGLTSVTYILARGLKKKFTLKKHIQYIISLYGFATIWGIYTGSLMLRPNNEWMLGYLSVSQPDRLIGYVVEALFPWTTTLFLGIGSFQIGALFIFTYVVVPILLMIGIAQLSPTKDTINGLYPPAGGRKPRRRKR